MIIYVGCRHCLFKVVQAIGEVDEHHNHQEILKFQLDCWTISELFRS